MPTKVIEDLAARGVKLEDIADIVYQLQSPYYPDLTRELCIDSVRSVLRKREVQHAVYTGIALDILAEQKSLPEPLQSIMEQDEGLYGIDEILALSITNVYGSIAMTNFGYLDKTKLGILDELNNHGTRIHVFLDDLVASIAASAAARIAHQHHTSSYQEGPGGRRRGGTAVNTCGRGSASGGKRDIMHEVIDTSRPNENVRSDSHVDCHLYRPVREAGGGDQGQADAGRISAEDSSRRPRQTTVRNTRSANGTRGSAGSAERGAPVHASVKDSLAPSVQLIKSRGDTVFKDLFHKKRHYATLAQPVVKRSPVSAEVKDIPKGIVNKCKCCGAILIARELQKNLYTCPHCDYHFPLDAATRILLTLDDDEFFEYDPTVTSKDPLSFPGYPEKLKKAQAESELLEGAVTGCGKLGGIDVVVGVMDPRFIMGSMGSAVGEKLARAMERAADSGMPFILYTASGGARMQEGVLSLMQMAKTSVALERMHQKGVLFVTVITNPTTGGVSASFASLGDIILAEPGALFGFAGRRVIEQTIRQKLPDDFQTAEFMLKHGMIDRVVHRKHLKETLETIVRIHSRGGFAYGG